MISVSSFNSVALYSFHNIIFSELKAFAAFGYLVNKCA